MHLPKTRIVPMRVVRRHVIHATWWQWSSDRSFLVTDEPAQHLESVRAWMPNVSGGYIEEAIPDPIPNSEVKLLGADGTAWATVWESRTLPG